MDYECSFLNRYPFDEYYVLCEQYIRTNINWDERIAEIGCNGVSYFDVSDVISLFPHLELDENYKLICYLSREYHGVWGRIAAIVKGADLAPVFDSEFNLKAMKFLGIRFNLPEKASPPMEAIYHDGTNEGYLEAILCSHLMDAIPYAHFVYRHRVIIMDDPPTDLSESWNTIVNVVDWTPRRVGNSIIAFRREIEDGFESSDGKDRIYLSQFHFERYLGSYHAFKMKNRLSMYRNQIDDDKRYNKDRHCCVFTERSVLIAREL